MACVHSSKQDFAVPPRSLPCGGWKCVFVFLHKCTDPGVWRQLLEPQAVAVVQFGGPLWSCKRGPHDLSPLAAGVMQPHRMSGHAVHVEVSLLESAGKALRTRFPIQSFCNRLC